MKKREVTTTAVQYLDKKGQVVNPLPEFANDPSLLTELYRLMVLIRLFDKKVVSLQRTGKMGTFASSLGQEGFSVGVGSALKKEDLICPYYRDQGILYQRRVKLMEILQFWGGDERGNRYIYNQEDFPIAIPIATQLVHAVGMAYAVKLRKQTRAVLTTCGDGATSEGDFYVALNGAGSWNLPLVIVINNNQWAISVPRTLQTRADTLAQKAIAAGIESVQVDGNDVIAVRKVAEDALEKARSGGGPTLIEALTYRLCDHTTADDATRYVAKSDLEKAWTREPLLRFNEYLMKNGILSLELDEKIKTACKDEVDLAVNQYLSLPPQPPESIFDYQYANLPVALQEQKEDLALNL